MKRLVNRSFFSCFVAVTIMFMNSASFAVTKISQTSGNFNSPSLWSPAGIPTATDHVSIQSGHTVMVNADATVASITIEDSGKLAWMTGFRLSINSDVTVNGILEITEGNINIIQPGSKFGMGPNGVCIWQPKDNSAAGATLFTNCTEDFDATSTLVIKKMVQLP